MADIPPYDWDSWLNGELWKLQRGKDFETDPRDFTKVIRMHARRHGKKAVVHTYGNKVGFWTYVPETAEEEG